MVVFLNLLSFRVELFFNRIVFYKSIRQAQIAWKRMQEKGLRVVFNDNTTSYENLLKKATLATNFI